MYLSDLLSIIQWWSVFFIIGIIFLPLVSFIFSGFFDRGYIFAKIIGIACLSYTVFLFGILKILPFTQLTVILILILALILNLLVFSTFNVFSLLKKYWRIFIFEELLFLGGLFFWSFIRAHQPDIHGLEKYMDFGFINSILRSEFFPPKDMWFTSLSINYYYFGHLTTAVLTKLSNIPSPITFNLMVATVFAFTFTGSFSIGGNLVNQVKSQNLKLLVGGLLTAFLVTFAGNLHTIYALFKTYDTQNPLPFWQLIFSPLTFPNNYWYPNATRFIPFTIHEFPIYSFVVSDLHGHVLDIPFVLLTIAFLLNILISKSLNIFKILFLSLLLAVMYMTNAWDGIIYLLLAGIVIFYKQFIKLRQHHLSLLNFEIKLFINLVILNLGFFIFSLPFNLNFKPFVAGIGILCAPQFLINIGKLGPFLFEANHCQKSPWWQLIILYGFFYFWVTSFLFFLFKKRPDKRQIQSSDIFIFLLIIFSSILIILPEFIYAKDIYPAHYRANTMFKFVYQSFIMLSISSGYIILQIVSNIRKKILAVCLLSLIAIYPFFTINSYYGNLEKYKGLDGLSYLGSLYPTDYEAILWLRKNINGQPVILEANGDSYTDFARVSANSGLPTVIGWPVHEWLWRGSYDVAAPRIADAQKLYETADINIAKQLINKYKISLVFIGDLEYQKYPNLAEEKFNILGTIIYQNGKTKVYKLNSNF